jgi:phosphatidylglycerophosphate synthase
VPAEPDDDDSFAARAHSASLLLALILLAALALCLMIDRLEPLAVAGPLGLSLLLLSLRGGEPRVSVLPNLITALRVALTGALGLGLLGAGPLPCALMVLAIFTLDGIDGTLARRLSASSPVGAHFDMESDGYLVLMLCALLQLRGLGSWVLLGGLLRYVYVITTGVFSSRGEAPPSRVGRYAFSLSLTALTLALLAGDELARALALLGTGVLGGSFARTFYWAFRAAPARA